MSKIFYETLFKEAYVLTNAAKNVDQLSVNAIIEKIVENAKAHKHIILSGIGKNSFIAHKIAATWASVGVPAFTLDTYHALHGDLGNIMPGSLVIFLSKSGKTPEMLETIKHCARFGADLVSITCGGESPQHNLTISLGGISLLLDCLFEADHLNLAPSASSTLLLGVGDALGFEASSRIGFNKQDFLDRHPAGALGEKLKEELK